MMYKGKESFIMLKKTPVDYKEVIKEVSPLIASLQLEMQSMNSLCDVFHSKSYDLKIDVEPLTDCQAFDLMKTNRNMSFREIRDKYVNVLVTVNFFEPVIVNCIESNRKLVKEIERTREVERIYSTSYDF